MRLTHVLSDDIVIMLYLKRNSNVHRLRVSHASLRLVDVEV